ncbi:MAG: tRNA pseudouridine(38-40) synthase TruA [Clostridia bacterium]|nr:tRNA pseudouridine(38-40) synthase TruA [Clostridia bacterium]MBQ7289059.1 tRNA pseudouridine(38-40) synthase TruA [Clostridia bacterium]
MKRFLLKLQYDGTHYHGWQVQANAVTVQEVLQDVLRSLTNGDVQSITGCSRTDSGVHANGFYCHFDTGSRITATQFVRALNAKLPEDIAVLHCREVDPQFHARYSAKGKQYIYRFYHSAVHDPFRHAYALRLDKPLSLSLLNSAAEQFIGTHDFSAFCATGSSVENTVRTITECSFSHQDNETVFTVTGNGFLYNMVRIMVGTLLEVQNGKIPAEDISKIINGKCRTAAGKTAPPYALYLNEVYY